MSLTQNRPSRKSRETGTKRETDTVLKTIIEEAERDKEAVTFSLIEKAINADNPDLRTSYYILASFLRKGKVVPYKDNKILGTDGKNFHVGYLYKLAKEQYGEDIVPFLWLHEVMHIIHVHPTRMKLVDDPELYNIIADLYVNTHLANLVGKIPKEFVRLDSFLLFIADVLKKQLTEKEVGVIRKLARDVVREKVTVEDAYNVISKIKPVRNTFKREFQKSSFFGKDMLNQNERKSGSSSPKNRERKKGESTRSRGNEPRESWGVGKKENKTGKGGNSSGGNGGMGKDERKEGTGGGTLERADKRKDSSGEAGDGEERQLTDYEYARKIEGILRELRKRIGDVMREIKRSKGEFTVLSREFGKSIGDEKGVFGKVEYKELQKLRVSLEEAFISDIGRVIREYEVNFSRFSREAYWLPESKEKYMSKIKVFLDTSGSISYTEAVLFMNWVRQAMKKYGLEVDLIVFSVGKLEKTRLTTYTKLNYVPKGSGTVWDKSVADEFINAIREEVPAIIVLSDMYIEIKSVAREAIEMYKRKGGKIICWTTGGKSDICDIVHKFPKMLHR